MELVKKQELDYIGSVIQKEINKLEKIYLLDADSNQKTEVIGKINLLINSQELLRRCYEYNILPKSIWRKLPGTKHNESEYRIFEDFESENKEVWNELENFRLDGGEVIIG